MVRPFKFLTENVGTTYHGQMSLEALEFFNQCEVGVNRRYEIMTELARYKLIRTDFRFGRLDGGLIEVFPFQEPEMKIIYTIINREIVMHEVILE